MTPPLPPQRYTEHGWDALSEVELLAIMLGPGLSDEGALEKAGNVIARLAPSRGLAGASLAELGRAGLSSRKALSLQAAFRLSDRLASPRWEAGFQVTCSRQIFEYFQRRLLRKRQEVFWNVLLDGKNRIVELRQVSQGSLTSSLVHPREVFRPALLAAAAGSVFVHNHPSGDPEPSREDLEVTTRLKKCGKLLGLRVVDHVIIGADRYFSFADQGLL